MTRKDYELIARTLNTAKPGKPATPAYNQWLETCGTFAVSLATTNAAFDRARFLKACGL